MVIGDFRYPREATNENMESLRLDLPYIRAVAGWSQDAFSKKLGVTRTTYRKLEKREIMFSPVYYYAICRIIEDEIKFGRDGFLQDILNLLNSPDGIWYGINRNEFTVACEDIIAHSNLKEGYRAISNKVRGWVSEKIHGFQSL